MKILLLLCLCGLACALPARPSSFYERFKNIPLFEVEGDNEGDAEDDGLFEVEERNFGARRNNHQGINSDDGLFELEERNFDARKNNHQRVNLDRFKNIPLFFLNDDDDEPLSRSAPKRRTNAKVPLFYYSERQNIPNYRSAPNRVKNIPLIILNEDPESLDDVSDDIFEVEYQYDDEDDIVPPVFQKKPAKRPQQNNRPRPNKPNRPNKRPQKPKPKPKPTTTTTTTTTERPAVPEVQQFEISETPLSETQNRITLSTDTIEVMKDNQLIQIPVPKSLEIVAFITKDGSIYEIDNGEENLLIVGKNGEKSEGLKSIMEKSLQHTIKKIFVDEQGSGRSEAIIEVKEDDVEPIKILEDVQTDQVQTTPEPTVPSATVEKKEVPLFRNASVDTIST